MFDFLQDSFWQFVVLSALALITIIVSVLIFILQRKSKAFACQFSSVAQIVSVNSKFQDSVQILYNGEVVENARMILIRFFNSGNMTIRAQDFHDNAGICFAEPARILSFTLESVEPESISVELSSDEQTLWLKPTLFNAGDFVEVSVVVQDYDGHSVVGRIDGVKDIKFRSLTFDTKAFLGYTEFFFFFMNGLALSMTARALLDETYSWALLVFLVITFASAVLRLFYTALARGR